MTDTLYKLVDGEPVELTPEEVAEYEAGQGAEPPPPSPTPILIASGIFQVADGNVSYSGQPAGIGFAMQMDTGKFWLFFDDEQPDTSYAVYAGSSQGLVNYTDRQTTYFELSVTDGGAAIDPSEFSINVTVTRSI